MGGAAGVNEILKSLRSNPAIADQIVDLEDTLERQTIASEPLLETFVDFGPDFLSVIDQPPKYVIPEITPVGVLKNAHGDPRTMKTLGTSEECVAAATGTPAYGLERFTPSRPYYCLYCSQEDAAVRVRPRFKSLLASRGITAIPNTLAFAVFKGIDLDNPEWQERFFEEVIRFGFELVAIDPIRAFTAYADGGPKDVMPLAKFFRRLTTRGVTVHIVHHDTKPPSNGPDTRRRSHRASGGGWFSVSECPVSFEKLGQGRSLVIPEDFKFSQDPLPFTITYHEDESGIRLVGEDQSAHEAQSLAIDEKVLAYLADKPAASGNSIVKALHVRRETVGDSLDRLFKAGQLDCAERGRSKLWTLRGEK
jgi:hypothetical protein